jgi:methionine synthase I (cobalamin-dependent)
MAFRDLLTRLKRAVWDLDHITAREQVFREVMAEASLATTQLVTEGEHIMSFLQELEADGQKVETFLENIITGGQKLVAAFKTVSAPTAAVVTSLINDVVKVVSSGEAAAESAASGNVPAAITLSQTTITGIKQLISDAKAGEQQAIADLAAFGIKL